jgi:hypothetical protein
LLQFVDSFLIIFWVPVSPVQLVSVLEHEGKVGCVYHRPRLWRSREA